MGVIVSSLISADGVRDDPMSWIGDLFDADAVEGSIAQLKAVDAFLMGRRSYDYFAPAWSGGGDPYSDALAAVPKYVFSATLAGTDWANTTIVRTDAVAACARSAAPACSTASAGWRSRCSRPGWSSRSSSACIRSWSGRPGPRCGCSELDRRGNGAVVLRYEPA
jgi:hypothetical protein